MLNRGEVWLAGLNPPYGTEPSKTLPAVVQAQALFDANHPSTLIIPLTTNLVAGAEPLRLRVPASEHLQRDADLLPEQLRVIDNRRLVQGPLARLSTAQMRDVAGALREVSDLDD